MSMKGSLQLQVTVPSYFVCPISLELMRDPVTISSGQTFDRSSIQTWLDEGHNTCPVTRFPIDCLSEEPIPNHTLRRLIQSWCVQHKSFNVERVLTPRQPPSLQDIPHLVDSLSPSTSSFDSLAALQQLSRLAIDRPLSRRTILRSGAIPHLTKILSRSFPGLAPLSSSLAATAPTPGSLSKADEALMLLDLLIGPSDELLTDHQNPFCDEELVMALANLLMRTSKSDSRLKSASVLLKLQLSDLLKRKVGQMQGFMGSLVAIIREDGASCKAALGLVVEVCSVSNRNRVLATEAGAMGALAELLVNGQGSDRATLETALKGVDLLCQCAEGRAVAANDKSILAAVVRQMSFVSERAAHYAIHIVLLVTKWAPESSKVKSLMVKEGALLKAIAVAQSAAAHDTRIAARKLTASLSAVVPPSHLSHTIR